MPGSGTTVTLLVKRSIAMAEEPADVAEEREPIGSASETILVVEDDDDVRAYTVATLRELGYRVMEAHDGHSALSLLAKQEQPIHLLVTDVVMPVMSGSELAAAARSAQPGLKILYTSGYPRDAISNNGRLDAGVDLLAKPFTMRGLATRVREIIDRI